ncbi:hypothetical protein ABIA71_003760 [Stenotrophomonas sp. 2619]
MRRSCFSSPASITRVRQTTRITLATATAAMILLTACGKPAPDSAAARAAARRIADEKVRACALAKTGSETGMTFISDARSDTAWSYEYEGDGRLCMVWVGDDGKVEIDPPGN